MFDYSKTPLTEIYGSSCFNDSVMRERLPKTIYKEVQKVLAGERDFSSDIAEVVASAMKDWAIERGATHYTHWFQPLTGLTAEKHDSFINPTADGKVILDFSGKELIQGEPDASSFPNGGIRETFEARGYTAWDVTSPAFLKKVGKAVTLCIPTAFISYTSEALDKKTPLLRSMNVIGKQALRVVKALGNTSSKRVITTVGPEQEYFLVDKDYFNERPDLLLTGRTVFGSMPAKGQELDDHYFGAIKDKVVDFMHDLNAELWKYGISAKTQHNEVAPGQFEIAPIFATANVSTDQNQLTMETIKNVAKRKGLEALLHEKPFAGVNGSGKHNNWSIATDDGINLLNPGDNPHDNAQFLVFLSAVIKAVDTYAPLLRVSAANAGNDHRLGANEAPPAIISIFLGDQLSSILESIAGGKKVTAQEGGVLEIGVNSLPKLPKDLTDRNRTSPFAFTGNKFEFRMVPSSESIAGANVVLNTAVADVLSEFADILEGSDDVNSAIQQLVADTYKAHSRIIFNGNGYGEEWLAEAEKRGLPNLSCTVDALPAVADADAKALFSKFNVLSEVELDSRLNIYLEKYSKQINIEASVMYEMAMKSIFPAANEYATSVASAIASIKSILPDADTSVQESVLKLLADNIKGLGEKSAELLVLIEKAVEMEEDLLAQAKFYRAEVFTKMEELRVYGDALEKIVAKDYWPFPTYEDLLFRL